VASSDVIAIIGESQKVKNSVLKKSANRDDGQLRILMLKAMVVQSIRLAN
jgi:hypothetical protein